MALRYARKGCKIAIRPNLTVVGVWLSVLKAMVSFDVGTTSSQVLDLFFAVNSTHSIYLTAFSLTRSLCVVAYLDVLLHAGLCPSAFRALEAGLESSIDQHPHSEELTDCQDVLRMGRSTQVVQWHREPRRELQ